MSDTVEVVWHNDSENNAGFNAFDDIMCHLFYGPSLNSAFTDPNPAYVSHIHTKD